MSCAARLLDLARALRPALWLVAFELAERLVAMSQPATPRRPVHIAPGALRPGQVARAHHKLLSSLNLYGLATSISAVDENRSKFMRSRSASLESQAVEAIKNGAMEGFALRMDEIDPIAGSLERLWPDALAEAARHATRAQARAALRLPDSPPLFGTVLHRLFSCLGVATDVAPWLFEARRRCLDVALAEKWTTPADIRAEGQSLLVECAVRDDLDGVLWLIDKGVEPGVACDGALGDEFMDPADTAARLAAIARERPRVASFLIARMERRELGRTVGAPPEEALASALESPLAAQNNERSPVEAALSAPLRRL
jgi:hypothetical protein